MVISEEDKVDLQKWGTEGRNVIAMRETQICWRRGSYSAQGVKSPLWLWNTSILCRGHRINRLSCRFERSSLRKTRLTYKIELLKGGTLLLWGKHRSAEGEGCTALKERSLLCNNEKRQSYVVAVALIGFPCNIMNRHSKKCFCMFVVDRAYPCYFCES